MRIIGFVIGLLIAALLESAFLIATQGLFVWQGASAGVMLSLVMYIMITGPVILVAGMVIGAPLLWILSILELEELNHYRIFGILFGVLAFLGFITIPDTMLRILAVPLPFVMGLLLALILRQRRPAKLWPYRAAVVIGTITVSLLPIIFLSMIDMIEMFKYSWLGILTTAVCGDIAFVCAWKIGVERKAKKNEQTKDN